MRWPEPTVQRYVAYGLSLAIGAGLWQLAAAHTSPAFLSSFTATIAKVWEFLVTGVLIEALASSLLLFAVGLSCAIIVGVLFGLLLARVRLLRVALESYITILYATPMVALIPFILSMMGFGFAPKALVVFLFAFFPVLYNTVEGARSLRPELLEVARSFRSSEAAIWRDVLVPYTLPFALTGVRQAVARGLVGMIAAEFFLSSSGIGQLIMRSGQDFDIPALYGAILVVTILGVALMAVGRMVENRFAAWRGLER
ncbi:MAG TPA: ABC transporter permease [Xanthobacteraceae bacterium]|nr:ABC transporter permease [Xanthobacteraceae bacterium]